MLSTNRYDFFQLGNESNHEKNVKGCLECSGQFNSHIQSVVKFLELRIRHSAEVPSNHYQLKLLQYHAPVKQLSSKRHFPDKLQVCNVLQDPIKP